MDYLAYPIQVAASPLEDRELVELAEEYAGNQEIQAYLVEARRALSATYTDDALNREIDKWCHLACLHEGTVIGALAEIVHEALFCWRDAVQDALRAELARLKARNEATSTPRWARR